jgi:hypothetical protein
MRNIFAATALGLWLSAFVTALSPPLYADTETFRNPIHNGNRLDWCYAWGTGCGQAAADAWCRAKQFRSAQAFTQDPDIGSRTPTRLISTGAICDQSFCDGFRSITCWKPAQYNPPRAFEPDVDRKGGDYTSVTLPAGAVPTACRELCAADATHCKAWTYVKAGVQAANPRCWLKNTVPAAVSSNCCSSGVMLRR